MITKQWWERRKPTRKAPVLCWVSNLNSEETLQGQYVFDYSEKNGFLTTYGLCFTFAEPIFPIEQYTYWPGGKCPVAAETMVDCIYRDGHIEANTDACFFDWSHKGTIGDVIAYRIHVED